MGHPEEACSRPPLPDPCIEPFPLQACISGDPVLIRAILNDHPEAAGQMYHSVAHNYPLPMLFVAAENGHLESATILIKENAEIIYQALTIAMQHKNNEALETLVAAARQSENELTGCLLAKSLYKAAADKCVALVDLLVARADTDAAITIAINNDNLAALSELINAGANRIDVLYQIASKSKSVLLNRMINDSTSSEERNHVREAALYAAIRCDAASLRLFARNGVNPNHLLLFAICHDAGDQAISTILETGVSKHEALRLAAEQNNFELFAKLLGALGTDATNYLQIAVQCGDTSLVKYLLHAGLDPDNGNPSKPLLFVAAGNGHDGVVKALLASRTLDAEYRPSMIYQAALSADKKILLSLLNASTSNEQNINDISMVLQKAISDENCGKQVLARLTQSGESGKVGEVLAALIKNNDLNTLTGLLKLGTAPDFVNSCGRHLLHIAARNGNPAVVKLLLDHGANPLVVTSNGISPLAIAAKEGNKPMVMTLIRACGNDDINSAIYTAIGQQDNVTLRHLIGMTDMEGPDFRQMLAFAARNNNIEAIRTMAKDCRQISADIAFFQAYNHNDEQLISAFLQAGLGQNNSSNRPLLLMAAISDNASMVTTMIQHYEKVCNEIYQFAAARETEAFTIMLGAFVKVNSKATIDHLIEDMIHKSNDYKEPVVISALVDIARRTGLVNINKTLRLALKRWVSSLVDLESTQQQRNVALEERLHTDGERARMMGAKEELDFEPFEFSSTSDDIESRIDGCDELLQYHKLWAEKNKAIVMALIKAGVDITSSEDDEDSILTLAIDSKSQELVKDVLTSLFIEDQQHITPEIIRTATEKVIQSITAHEWGMAKLLLTYEALIDPTILNKEPTLLYEVAKFGDSVLVRTLWQLGVKPEPSLNIVLSEANVEYLKCFVDAGIVLNKNDDEDIIHPLTVAAMAYAGGPDLTAVRLVLRMCKDVDAVIYDLALCKHNDVIAMIWHCANRDQQLIRLVIDKAIATNNTQVIRTLLQIDGITTQLGQYLFDAAKDGSRDVVKALIAGNADIVDSLHNPAHFLYLIAQLDLTATATVLTNWQSKFNRNIPIIISQTCDVAEKEQHEQNQDICDFLRGWLMSQVP